MQKNLSLTINLSLNQMDRFLLVGERQQMPEGMSSVEIYLYRKEEFASAVANFVTAMENLGFSAKMSINGASFEELPEPS